MSQDFPKAEFYKYDTDIADEIVNELGVHQMPTFHIFRSGELKDTMAGPQNEKLRDAIRQQYGIE